MLVKRLSLGILLLATTARAAAPSFFDAEVAARRAELQRAGTTPRAIAPLLDVFDLWDYVHDRAAVVAFLDDAVAAPLLPILHARAVYLAAIAHDRAGDATRARELRAQLGLVTDWWFVGPFDNEGKAGHAAQYPPEHELRRAFDPAATYEGKERRVAWRHVPPPLAGGVAGMVPLDAMLRPEASVSAYATVAIKSPRAQRAALRVSSSGAIKVWVDGQLVHDHDVYRPVRFDQDAAPVELAAGWNRVTVKISSAEQGGLRFFFRLTAPDGAPLAGLESSTRAEDLTNAAVYKTTDRAPAFAVADVGALLDAEAHKKTRDPEALVTLGRYVRAVSPDDPEKHRAAEILAEAARVQPSARTFRFLADAQTDANDQRKALEEGLALVSQDPRERARLDAHLGDLWARARRERHAEEMWRAALVEDPSYWPAEVALAELDAERGLPSRAAAALERVAAAHPTLKVVRAQAHLALRRGRRAEAQTLLGRALDGQRLDDDTVQELFAIARGRGALDDALKWADLLIRARPDLLSAATERADLLDGLGRSADAHATLTAALAIAPEDHKLLERDGRVLHRLGKSADALAELRRALELHPQNPELRAYVAELTARERPKDTHAAVDLAATWAVDVPKLIARTRGRAGGDASVARVLYDQEVTRVHPNGLSETFQQRVVEVLDERGARDQGDFDIRFTPDTQAVELRAARVYKPNGDVIEAISTDEQSVSDPAYGLYYDVHAQLVRFSALAPGDVIDVEYVISDVGRRNLFADYFGDLHFFQEDMPRVEQRYVLIAPRARALYFNEPRLTGIARTVEERGDERVYTFAAKDTPKTASEPGMPGFSEIAAYVHVSTYRTWEDVTAWYRGLLRGQLDPSPAIIAAVKEATRGLTDERAKIRALYDLVVRRTRYVGLEFGIHGYQPYRVSQVFARKFGDCKDKASLLKVMLELAGIDATVVLARTRPGGNLDAVPASLAPFDHAIVYVPKYDWFLDGTAEFSGADELPASDQDIPVLLVNTGKLQRTPVLPAARNTVATDWRVQLDRAGGARVDETITVSGQAAHEWRSHYQSAGERSERYARAWNGKQPGARIEKLEMSVDELEQPVGAKAIIEVPHWARPQDDVGGAVVLGMPALGREADMLRSFARLSARKLDLILGYPWRQEERVAVKLPAGFTPRRLPEARVVEAPFGKFQLAVDVRGGEVVVTATLEVTRHRIARGDYAAFRAFCADVDAAVAQEIVVAAERPKSAEVR
jgi:transglutaminase-like putative cysteine protease/tetratricopeptide (TPR) repeat protein